MPGELARGSLGRCSRRYVPWNDKYCPRRASKHPFSDRAFPESLPAASPVGTEDDEICSPGVGVQHDDLSRVPLLLDDPYWDAFPFSALPEVGEQFEPFARSPRKPLGRGYRVKDIKPGFARTGNAERAVESVAACFRQVDCAQYLLDRCHAEVLRLSGAFGSVSHQVLVRRSVKVTLALFDFWCSSSAPAPRRASTAVRRWPGTSPRELDRFGSPQFVRLPDGRLVPPCRVDEGREIASRRPSHSPGAS